MVSVALRSVPIVLPSQQPSSIAAGGILYYQSSIAEKRTSTGNESPLESPSRHRSDKSKHSRRRHSSGSGGSSLNSSKRSATESTRRIPNSSLGPESPARGSPPVPPKTSRRKKSKNLSGESSQERSRSKNKSTSAEAFRSSDPGMGGVPESGSGGLVLKSKETCQTSVLKASEEESALNEISARIHAL
ncbi:hypothetical protein Nepgr_021769 [Nepenthes gracilis]|uniref:Uncharacterized protein n=1 Tax=Nepenthes gracilis TaxID=150966 RepID=A0AAD3SZ22_NEPGR|nr:hypothetical protein Nepgr_021769 [Nepenthes gracilis]